MRPWLIGFATLALLVPSTGCGRRTPGAKKDCWRDDGVVRVAISAQPNTLDWSRSSETSYMNYPVIHAMMRGLTALDEKHQPIPDLAERWEIETTADGHQVYTFHLRAGLVWSDGTTPLTAADFVFGWRRAIQGFEPAELADLLGADEVVRAREANDPAATQAAVARLGVEAVDDLTLRVTLKSPRSYFLARVAYVYPFFPAPSRVLAGKSEDEIRKYFDQPGGGKPVVMGAFMVDSWDRSVEHSPLKLVPNPHYPGSQDPGAAKGLMVLQSDLSQELYDRCDIDFLYLDDPAELNAAAASGAPYTREPLLSTYWLGLNTSKVNLPLRRAISYALDRKKLVDGLLPTMRPALGLLPPDLPGAVDEGDPLAANLPRFDLAKARQLVKDSGYAGEPLTLLVRSSGTFMPEVAIADGIRRQLGEVGIQVTLTTTADFANDIKDPAGNVRYHMFLKRTGADYAHPQTFLLVFTPSGNNYTEWQKIDGGAPAAAFQALLEQGAAESDPLKMKQVFTRAQEMLLVDQAVLVPIYHPDRYYRKRSWLDGLGVDPFNFVTLRSMRLRSPQP